MIILDATTKTLEIDLAGAITTSQLPVVASYVDVTTTAYTPISTDTATNSTTAVTIVSAPAASTQRQVKLLTVYNADTVSATVTIQLNNNGTLRILVAVVLAAGSTLIYTDGEGWRVLTSAGAIVTSTLSPMTSAQLAAILSDETGTGAAVFATSPIITTDITIPNTGLHLLDTNGSHDLIVAPGSDLTADRILSLVTGDANRTLTLTGNATLNQDVSSTGSPTFAQATVDNLRLDGNTLSSTSGTVTVTPLAGQNLQAALSAGGMFQVRGDNNAAAESNTLRFVDTDTSSQADQLTGKIEFYTSDATPGPAGVHSWVAGKTEGSSGLGYLQFAAGQSGSAAEAARISSGGHLLVGLTTNSGKMAVAQASTTAAIPAVYLSQSDISEGFIDYIGTSAASAAGPISTWTVATLAGFTRCEINGAAFWMPFYNAPTA